MNIFKKQYDKYGKLIAKGIMNYLGLKIPKEEKPAAKTETTAKAPAPKEILYRVRKSWNDPKSQIGAYKILANAKSVCEEYPGYSVYDEKGKVLYTKHDYPQKMVDLAKKYCWPYGTDEKKWSYSTGKPLAAYVSALKKFMNKTEKESKSDCGYLMDTIVRASGCSSSFLALKGNADPFPKAPDTMRIVHQGKDVPNNFLRPGDIIRYKKTNGSQHTLMYIGDDKIAEAGRKVRFPVIQKDTKKYNANNVKSKTLQVIRAK